MKTCSGTRWIAVVVACGTPLSCVTSGALGQESRRRRGDAAEAKPITLTPEQVAQLTKVANDRKLNVADLLSAAKTFMPGGRHDDAGDRGQPDRRGRAALLPDDQGGQASELEVYPRVGWDPHTQQSSPDAPEKGHEGVTRDGNKVLVKITALRSHFTPEHVEVNEGDVVTRRITAVDDAYLQLPAGDSVALWGVNGAGKTTLIRCVLGLLAFRGRVFVGGHDVARRGKHARMLVGYVPQELGFYGELGVAESLAFFGRLQGLGAGAAAGAFERVGLAGQERKRVRELSGGMKQRLALVIALLGDPPVLVLDEVTASLDAVGREQLVGLLERLSGGGRTVLIASHRIEEVAALAKRVVVLERGRITRVDACAEFIASRGRGAVLHLVIPRAVRQSAIDLLRAGGYDPRLNGVGVMAPVSPDQKAGPFRVLAEGRVPIEDFELVAPARAAAMENRP